MSLTGICSPESARTKIFHELDVHHVKKVGAKRFLSSGGRTESNGHLPDESARRKFFMNSTYIMSRKWESNVFGLRRSK